MKKRYLLLILTVLLISCSNEEKKSTENTQLNNDIAVVETPKPEEVEPEVTEPEVVEPEEPEIPVPEVPIEEVIDYQALYQTHQVNELGQLMVLMYHNIAEEPAAYATTVELFKADLERLYNEGYRTVSITDLVNNTIDIPIGTTPVVLTFDDASKSNFFYTETGEVSPESVVGILDAFALEHEGFGKNAIFYIYGTNPFRDKALIKEKFEYLIQEGYEIGNHSYGHDKLSKLGEKDIQKSLGREQAFLNEYVDYQMAHISLPYGLRPGESLVKYVFDGQYEETVYSNISAVNVGWNPIKSPAHQGFNPKSINRVTCGTDDFELNYWLDYFVDNPSKKYISDGDPNTVVIPKAYIEDVNPMYIDQLITYEEEE